MSYVGDCGPLDQYLLIANIYFGMPMKSCGVYSGVSRSEYFNLRGR
jgi:hypothetical protein